jgi:hypothetical protein
MFFGCDDLSMGWCNATGFIDYLGSRPISTNWSKNNLTIPAGPCFQDVGHLLRIIAFS